MKRLLTAFAVMLLACALLAGSISAAECGRQKVNVAEGATLIVETEDTNVTDYIDNLIDGDKNTGIKSSTKDTSLPIKLEFPGTGEILEDVIITVISADKDGLASGATGLANRAFGAKLEIYIYPVDNTEPLSYEITPAASQKEVKIDLSTYQKTIRMIEINVVCNNSANHPIWEIEANKYEGNHSWTLDESTIIKKPSCTEIGRGNYSCSCGATKEDDIPMVQHSFTWKVDAETHYKLCSVCNTRESEGAHEYDHDCDKDCNVCFRPRVVAPHTYRAPCATVCEKCGSPEGRTPENPNHLYYQGAACDEYCDLCFEKRETTVAHTWDNNCDAECNSCRGTREVPPHIYTNDAPCDIVCDECGAQRTVTESHRYTNDSLCDEYCDACLTKRENVAPHDYPNPCAPKCRDCGNVRTTETDPTYSAEHVYDSLCDPDCNNCGTIRSIQHEYSSACDDRCDKCNAQRQAAKHNFPNKGTVKFEPTEKAEGIETYTCKECGKTETRTIPKLEPEDNTPIIIAIVVSASVIVVCAIIAVCFLIIKPRMDAKKKRIADILRAQEEERIAREKAEAEAQEQAAREALTSAFGGSMYDESESDDTTNAFAGLGIGYSGIGTGNDGSPTDGLNDDPSDDFVSNPNDDEDADEDTDDDTPKDDE